MLERALQDRALATRRRLLDAAFEVLVEAGYSRASTAEICRRSRTPRGTMLYHYPSRDALMIAAMEHVLARRLEAFRSSVTAEDTASPDRFVRSLFAAVRGPQFDAWLELVTAARTNPGLRAELGALAARFDALVEQTARTLLPTLEHQALRALITLVFATLNGLALESFFDREAQVAPALEKLIEAVTRWTEAG